MKKGKINILIFCTIALVIIAMVFIMYILDANKSFNNRIVIRNNGKAHEILEVSDLSLLPSQSKDYEIELVSMLEGNFDLAFDFKQSNDGNLSEFVDVSIKVGEEVYFEGKLSELFAVDNVVTMTLYLDKTDPQIIVITYSMDSEVGNEAKNTYSTFVIDLTIERNVGEV